MDLNRLAVINTLNNMPDEKKAVLHKALQRNYSITSSYMLENGKVTIYAEGAYLQLTGVRCSFSVFVNADGKFTRKPNENKLTKLFEINTMLFNENDFKNL